MRKFKTILLSFLVLVINLNIIAQEFNWAKRAGGNDADDVFDLVTDGSGNIYVCGYFKNTAYFGEGSNQVSLTSSGGADIYFAKYNSFGELIWIEQAGGSTGFDWGNSIALDSQGNIFICGYFDTEASFGEGSSEVTLTASGDNRDIYICKYNSSGELLWAQNDGGDYDDSGQGLVVDDNDNIIMVGKFKGAATFGTEPNTTTITAAGGGDDQDGFIVKYSNSGTLIWVEDLGFFDGSDGLSNVAIDALGNIYTGGYKYAGFLPYFDPLIAKFDIDGNLLWIDTPTGISNDNLSGLSVDPQGNIIITGTFTIDLVFGDITLLAGNDLDLTNIYLAKYSTDGNVIWAKVMPGTGGPTPHGGDIGDEGRDVVINDDGYVFLTGYIGGTTTFGNDCHTVDLISADYKDIFIAKLNGDADLQWAINTGGANEQTPSKLAISDQDIYICGDYGTSANFGGTYLAAYGGWSDIFIASLLDETTKSDYVKNLSAAITDWEGNASDITVSFNMSLNELTVSEYRVFIVKLANAGSFDLEDANTNTNFSLVMPDGSVTYSINPDENQKDTDGDDIGEGESYILFVSSIADGVIASSNSLSCESNEITILYTDITDMHHEGISIYPNPTSGIIYLKGNNILEVKVMDITGKTIYIDENAPKQIDLSAVKMGTYLIQIQTENNIYREKLIIH